MCDQCRIDSPPCPDPWRSSAPVSSSPRWPSSMPGCWRRPAAPGRASRSCRPPRSPTARTSSTAGRRWASPTSGSSAPRSSRSSCATAPRADDPAAAQAIGEADLVYLSGGKPGYLAATCSTGSAVGRALVGGARRGAPSWPAARPGRWSWPATCSTPRVARRCRGRSAGGPASGSSRARRSCPTTTRGRSRCPALVALQAPRGSVVLGIDEDTARRRPRRVVAGPRRGPRHGLARPPARTLSRRRDLPVLGACSARTSAGPGRQSGRTVRKQSEQ